MFGNGIKKKANADLQKMPTKHLSKAEELYTSNLLITIMYVLIGALHSVTSSITGINNSH